mgnify:CR=1 FL=1
MFVNNKVIKVNIIRIKDTDINDDIVFLLKPFKKNNMSTDIIKQITNVGIKGLNPQPTKITIININAKLKNNI